MPKAEQAAKALISSEEQRQGQSRPLDGNHKERIRLEVVEPARRVPQERQGTKVVDNAVSRRDETRRTRTPCAGQTHRRKGGEAQRERHGVPWWAAHGVP